MRNKLIILTAILGFCLSANAGNITKEYDLTFNGIEVSTAFDIQLIKADTHSVTIEIDEEYAPYLSVNTDAGILKVRFKKLPVKMQIKKDAFKMIVRTPMINYINLAGACKLSSNDEFSLGMNNFRAAVSGASTISNLKINSIDASFRISGASKVYLDGQFSDFEILAEGGSEITFNGNASDFHGQILSSSKFNVTGNIDEVDIEVKGASKVELNGRGVELDADVAGASKLDAKNFPVTVARISAKGASNVAVDAAEALKADISGASTCKYREHAGLRMNEMVSGGGSLKKL